MNDLISHKFPFLTLKLKRWGREKNGCTIKEKARFFIPVYNNVLVYMQITNEILDWMELFSPKLRLYIPPKFNGYQI